MLNIPDTDIKSLIEQIKQTREILEEKYSLSGEYVVKNYIKYYKNAVDVIQANENDDTIKKALIKILNCTRGYLETSSDYNQRFLNEMAETERYIKSIIALEKD